MKRATIAAIPQLLLVLFPFSVLADHHAATYHYHGEPCCQTNELPGGCGRCPNHFAFSLWANYCHEQKSCFRRHVSHCQSCVVDNCAHGHHCGDGTVGCQANTVSDNDGHQYPDPSVEVPSDVSPMTPVPESQDGEVVAPDEATENTEPEVVTDEAPELPEIPQTLTPDKIQDQLPEAAPESLQELEPPTESSDRSAWRRPSWLRFRSRFGL